MVSPHIIPNLFVSGLAFGGSHIQFIHADVHFDVPLNIEFGQKNDRFDSCFSFQGKFFHFLAINRHREIEYNLLYPASVFSLFREHLNSLDKGFHKLFLFCFRCGMVDFIKCQ